MRQKNQYDLIWKSDLKLSDLFISVMPWGFEIYSSKGTNNFFNN